MKTFTDILNILESSTTVTMCSGLTEETTDALKNYMLADRVREKINNIIYSHSFKTRVKCNVFYITYDETNDEFLLNNVVFYKYDVSTWTAQNKTIELKWVKTDNFTYTLIQQSVTPSYEIFINKLPTIIYKPIV